MRLPGKGLSWKEFLVGVKDEMSRDAITDVAATVTYYGLLSLFPFLLFLVALLSVVITPADAEKMVQQLQQMAPPAVTEIVAGRIRDLGQKQDVTLLGFGALGAIWAASGGVMALMRALNVTYDVQEGRPWWKVRLIAILTTFGAGAVALVAALVAVAAAPIADALGGPAGTAIAWLRLPVAGLLMMLLWAVVYYVLPDVEQDFKFITPGSVIGVLVWLLASWGFSKYVQNFGSYDKTYGSLAGVVVLMLWVWLSSLVLLAGAEVNAFIEHHSEEGKREGAKDLADSGTTPRGRVAARGEVLPAEPPERRTGTRPRGPVLGLLAFLAGIVVARRRSPA